MLILHIIKLLLCLLDWIQYIGFPDINNTQTKQVANSLPNYLMQDKTTKT